MSEKLHHWKELTDCPYIGAYRLMPGEEITLTIKSIANEIVTGADGKKENCVVCHWRENEKPMILNSTNMKMIQRVLKTPYYENWYGKKIVIGVDKVRAFGDTVEALRVRNTVPSEKKQICVVCKNEITSANNMSAEQVATYTLKMSGKLMCASCYKKMKEEAKNAETDA